VVETAAEADLALLFGLGFPPFRGGLMRWVDTIGLEQFVAMAERYSGLGNTYEITEGMRAKLANNETYYD
jgi:3-hydroxyacyl-CoA dehydrogenase/enoyl-CoA hydratase/3-hydroxybutyryl-CoA epimerase/enoyl-CoA isomerase